MFDQLVLYDTPACEHACVAVVLCREQLIEDGHRNDAEKLTGLVISSRAMAALALRVLGTINVSGASAELVESARHLCARVCKTRIPAAA